MSWKKTLLNIGGKSPYNALFGLQPKFIQELESMGQSAITDGDGGIIGASRHSVRLREIALQSIIETIAKARMVRADATKTRVSGEILGLEVGQLVELYRQPAQKDLVGWRGPASIVSIADLKDGYVDVKWKGRVMSVRIPDLRRAVFL